MSNRVKDFHYSRKLCNDVVHLKLKLNTVLQIFVAFSLLKESTSSRQDLDKLVANIAQLIEYGSFCEIVSTAIECIFEELLDLGLLLLNGNKISKNCKNINQAPQSSAFLRDCITVIFTRNTKIKETLHDDFSWPLSNLKQVCCMTFSPTFIIVLNMMLQVLLER